MAERAPAEKPKKHSAFMQVILRKSGEALDLGGKGLLGFSGLGHLLGDHNTPRLSWKWLSVEVILGGLWLLLGIYLQAKAEETVR